MGHLSYVFARKSCAATIGATASVLISCTAGVLIMRIHRVVAAGYFVGGIGAYPPTLLRR
jgi:hypothetical protein